MESGGKTFRTLTAPSGPVEFRERKSKFLGVAYPVDSTEQAREQVAALWQEFPDATHICYAYRIGSDLPEIRMNDDGEPSHSAGAPIFGQIESFDLMDVLVCVIRYYGGTKLGVGGLIQAYRDAARRCLEHGRIVTRIPKAVLSLGFTYADLDAVLRIIDQNRFNVVRREMALSCRIDLEVPVEETERVRNAFGPVPGVTINDKG
ncbi:YigZ family protein [Robiginitalea sp. SC105]|uniref:IMPACT family protein n=1 Tax=Robiginitalea sp. SC105 TaxID=2762332 RepID=UPI001639D6D5|nr:YigZ family protein [Robiginitalea sp. SC105]MBC2840783.1 YigZ family protein [Robiginitalea sp. SC105]